MLCEERRLGLGVRKDASAALGNVEANLKSKKPKKPSKETYLFGERNDFSDFDLRDCLRNWSARLGVTETLSLTRSGLVTLGIEEGCRFLSCCTR